MNQAGLVDVGAPCGFAASDEPGGPIAQILAGTVAIIVVATR